MPLYDFRCRGCGARFEARVPHGEAPPCPDCGEHEPERLLSPFAGPFTVAPRGAAARRSDAERRAREEQRRERSEKRRERSDQRRERSDQRGEQSEQRRPQRDGGVPPSTQPPQR